LGVRDKLAIDPTLYRALGRTAAERQKEYRALLRPPLAPAFVEARHAATGVGWALGGEHFKRQIAKTLRRRVSPSPRGRPPKSPSDKRQLNLL
jgi:putative transposase